MLVYFKLKTMNKENSIKSWTFFKGLDDKQVASLAGIAFIKKYQDGEIIFAEGDPGLGLHTVAAGRVKVFKSAPDGKEQILHLIEPGAPFGEVAVFLGGGYPAWSQAMGPVTTLFIPRSALRDLIAKDPDLALGMMAVLSMRLVGFTKMVESLTLKETPARLASYFLQLSAENQEAEKINLNLTKGQLASLLGTMPETLSRILNKMKNRGLISEEKPAITIINRPQLEALAKGLLRLTD